MKPSRDRQAGRRPFQWLRGSLAAFTTMLLLCASFPSGAASLADREYERAVQSFRSGRVSEAYGQFAELASRGDVDSARIALFLHTYGAALYGKHWDALQSDTAYWALLVRNSGTSARAQPDFLPATASTARKARSQGKAPVLRQVSTAR